MDKIIRLGKGVKKILREYNQKDDYFRLKIAPDTSYTGEEQIHLCCPESMEIPVGKNEWNGGETWEGFYIAPNKKTMTNLINVLTELRDRIQE